MEKRTKSDTLKKRAVIAALEKSMGIVTTACKNAKIARSTFYKWFNEDEDFRKEVNEMKEVRLDYAESKLFSLIEKEVPSSIYFFLKTQGKERGYVEKSEIDFTNKSPDLSELSVEEIKDMLNEEEGAA